MVQNKYDAVIIPGGGLDRETGDPQPWVVARLESAVKMDAQTKFYIVLSRGTTHRAPPRDEAGFPVDEAAASARFLIGKGVATERILLDTWSLDTIGNAYFARSMIARPLQLHKLCVVTSAFHMQRTRAVFNWVFGLECTHFALDYRIAPDVGLSPEALEARRAKETAGLERLNSATIPSIASMRSLASFLLCDHGAYNARSVMQRRQPAVDDKTSASY